MLEILSALKISKQYESLLSAMKIFLYSSHDMQSSHSSFLHFPVEIRVYWQYILYCKNYQTCRMEDPELMIHLLQVVVEELILPPAYLWLELEIFIF